MSVLAYARKERTMTIPEDHVGPTREEQRVHLLRECRADLQCGIEHLQQALDTIRACPGDNPGDEAPFSRTLKVQVDYLRSVEATMTQVLGMWQTQAAVAEAVTELRGIIGDLESGRIVGSQLAGRLKELAEKHEPF